MALPRALILAAFLAVPAAFRAVTPAPLAGQQRPGQGEARADTSFLDVRGRVVDAETREPIEGVAVTLEPSDEEGAGGPAAHVAISDAQGRFHFGGLPEGFYRIALEHLGYRTLVDSLAYAPSLGLRIEAEMVPRAVELEPLLVAVEVRSRHLEAHGFYRRQTRGVGRFISREEIEERQPLEVTDLLSTVPGVRLRYGRGTGGETLVLMRGGCLAEVYLDGVRTIPPFPLDTALDPADIAAIEIYHASETPARFRTSGCGTLLVWTRLPDSDELGNPFTLGRILAAVGFIGAVLLLFR